MKYFITEHAMSSLQIWNVEKSREVAYCPTGSDYWMIDVAFSPDGQKVVTLCDSIEVSSQVACS